MSILIRGGRLIDPAQQVDRVADVLIEGNRILAIDPQMAAAELEIDATGHIVCPGFIDLHASFREPGFEDDETTATGSAAALAGGFTSVCCLPDTEPVVDNRGAAEFLLLQAARAGFCRVLPLGAITKGRGGAELAEIGQLVEGGAVAFTDAGRPIANAEIMRRALEYTRMFECPLFNFPQEPDLVEDGVMHEGFHSMQLGLKGMPAAAQDIMVSRDIALVEMTDSRVHLMCISTSGSVDQIRAAKQRGLRVTCDVTPHHLLLTDENLRRFDANYKTNPPLRTRPHIDSLLEGLKDGTIDAICSNHRPFAQEKKQVELDLAPFGIVGLETLLPVCVTALIDTNVLEWPQLIDKLTAGPARVLGLDRGSLAVGSTADVTIIDPQEAWTIDAQQFHSRSRNTPFDGMSVRSQVKTVLVDGQIRFDNGQLRPHKAFSLNPTSS